MATTQSTIYDYLVKIVGNGSVKYYGAIVDGNRELLTEIPADLYTHATGRPDITSSGTDGVYRFRRPAKRGADLVKYIRALGYNRNYSPDTIAKAIAFIPNMTTAIAYLGWKGIPIKDINDAYEVALKYGYNADHIPVPMTEHDYNIAIEDLTTARNQNNFDFGAIFSGVFDFVNGIIQNAESTHNQLELGDWIRAFAHYMEVDFSDINRELEEHGPAAALTWLQRLKSTSWADLKAYNLRWTAAHHMDIPPQVLQLQAAQVDLENDLKQRVAQANSASVHAPNKPPVNPGEYGPPVVHKYSKGGSTTPPGAPDKPAFDATPLLIGLGALIAFKMIAK